MIVLTLDQRGSRTRPDAVPALLGAMAEFDAVRPFQRTAGDEVQAVFDDGRHAMRALFTAAVAGEWNVGLGVGAVRLPLPAETRAGAGEAFEAAREAVEHAKKSQALLAVRAPAQQDAAARLEAELALLVLTVRKRTPQQRQAVELRERGLPQDMIAARLGITQQAVSQRLASAMHFEASALEEAATLALEDMQATTLAA